MKLLLVEDSETTIVYLRDVCARNAEIDFLPPARDGREGIARALAERPDVILMDLNLPVLDGIAAIKEILSHAAIPIVVLSAHLDSSRTFAALSAGAVDVLPKPRGLDPASRAQFERDLLRTLRVMKEARVVQRKSSHRRTVPGGAKVVAIGASTGGPQVLHQLLSRLEPPFPTPILIVQHTYAGFDLGLARWLDSTGHTVAVLDGPEELYEGDVYLCPSRGHLVVSDQREVTVEPLGPEDMTASVDRLFESTAAAYGRAAIGVLLTGMGRDGAQGLLQLRRRGAETVTQLGSTCVVDGMPAAARALGASGRELDLQGIAEFLAQTCGGKVR